MSAVVVISIRVLCALRRAWAHHATVANMFPHPSSVGVGPPKAYKSKGPAVRVPVWDEYGKAVYQWDEEGELREAGLDG